MDRSGDIRNGGPSPKWERRLLIISFFGLLICGFSSLLMQLTEHSYGLKAWLETCNSLAMAFISYIIYKRRTQKKENSNS
jgi:hypothetical protein